MRQLYLRGKVNVMEGHVDAQDLTTQSSSELESGVGSHIPVISKAACSLLGEVTGDGSSGRTSELSLDKYSSRG